jgi:hypothetical protein
VNDERIQGDCELKAGDKIRVGKLEFEAVIKPPKKKKPPSAKPQEQAAESPATADTAERQKADSGSIDFDVSEWLEEADAVARSRRQSEPETRQFQLDDTDRLALEGQQDADDVADEATKKAGRPAKKAPGKLPQKPASTPGSSREAAADMLKKFFNNR